MKKTKNSKTPLQEKNKVGVPSKITTDASLVALTFAFLFIDLMSSHSDKFLTRVFRRDEDGEPVFIAELLLDQEGKLEEGIISQNGQTIFIESGETIEKLQELGKQKRNAKFYSDAEELFDKTGFNFENLKNVYSPIFQKSFNRASEVLFWVLFLEKFFKMDTAQNLISFCYALVRSIDYMPDFKPFKKDLMQKLGYGWRWKIAWQLALNSEKVRRFWDDKEKFGSAALDDWKAQCVKEATTRWNERKKHIERITDGSRILRDRIESKIFGDNPL